MATKLSKTSQEKIDDAMLFASRWLSEANEANEAGNSAKEVKCLAKAQYWLDRLNKLEGYTDDSSLARGGQQDIPAKLLG